MTDAQIDALLEFHSDLLSTAKAKHSEAIAAVQAHPLDMDRVKAAATGLDEAILLASDARDFALDIGAHENVDGLGQALADMAMQRDMLREGIARLEAGQAFAPAQPNPWATPWPWLSLALIVVALLGAIA